MTKKFGFRAPAPTGSSASASSASSAIMTASGFALEKST
jgi:hypothetical protein